MINRGQYEKGHVPWMKGRKHSMESIKKNSLSHIGKRPSPATEFKKGMVPWNKGRTNLQVSSKKGLSYERYYGLKKSIDIKNKISKTRLAKFKSGKLVVTDEHRKNLSISHLGLLSGCSNPNWNGGSSFEPYGLGWTEELKEYVRNRFDRICMMCFEFEKDEKLHVHHIDYNKRNHSISNLVPLHRHCHNKTVHYRSFWIEYFKHIVELW